jgi:signal transduction histidine kinase
MPSRPERSTLRYGVAVLSVILAAGITYLVPWLRHRESFILPIGAVALSAWYGGSRPAQVACIVGALLQNFFLFEPVNEFTFSPEATIPMGFFLIVALMIGRLTTALVAAREKAREQRRLSDVTLSALLLAEERQRRAIALGLHDSVGVSLGLTRIKLGTLRGQFSEPELVRQFDEISQLMKQIISEIRTLTFELSPPILYEVGLEAALEWLATRMQTQHQLSCQFKAHGSDAPLKQELDVLLFQTARELLVNVVKHARATRVSVELTKESQQVQLKVTDDGTGFDAAETMRTPEKTLGFGLFSMRERVNLVGGTFAIESRQGQGTCVTLSLPSNV